MADLHPVGSFSNSIAYNINSLGQIVGSATTSGGSVLCFRTVPGERITFARDDLGNLGFAYCEAFGVNNLDIKDS